MSQSNPERIGYPILSCVVGIGPIPRETALRLNLGKKVTNRMEALEKQFKRDPIEGRRNKLLSWDYLSSETELPGVAELTHWLKVTGPDSLNSQNVMRAKQVMLGILFEQRAFLAVSDRELREHPEFTVIPPAETYQLFRLMYPNAAEYSDEFGRKRLSIYTPDYVALKRNEDGHLQIVRFYDAFFGEVDDHHYVNPPVALHAGISHMPDFFDSQASIQLVVPQEHSSHTVSLTKSYRDTLTSGKFIDDKTGITVVRRTAAITKPRITEDVRREMFRLKVQRTRKEPPYGISHTLLNFVFWGDPLGPANRSTNDHFMVTNRR